jgi:hypothetical protein
MRLVTSNTLYGFSFVPGASALANGSSVLGYETPAIEAKPINESTWFEYRDARITVWAKFTLKQSPLHVAPRASLGNALMVALGQFLEVQQLPSSHDQIAHG